MSGPGQSFPHSVRLGLFDEAGAPAELGAWSSEVRGALFDGLFLNSPVVGAPGFRV